MSRGSGAGGGVVVTWHSHLSVTTGADEDRRDRPVHRRRVLQRQRPPWRPDERCLRRPDLTDLVAQVRRHVLQLALHRGALVNDVEKRAVFDEARGIRASVDGLLQEVFVKLAQRPDLLKGVRDERGFLIRLAQ